ncbi:MAG: hypothetical protein JWM81_643 [Candidatus Saccharibacteria bacterium]|nr:hypothetical protein [Candidatus Saccharibacteria bacterium]
MPEKSDDRAKVEDIGAIAAGSAINWSDAIGQKANSQDSVRWTASEFIAHQKTVKWYAILAGCALLAALIVWILTKDITASIVILVAALTLGWYGARQPRELEYVLDEDGLTIGPKHYPYASFRSFTVDTDAAFTSIDLIPLRRFAPSISIFYAPEDEDKIADILSAHIPYENRRKDPIDRFMKHIRF